MPGFDQQRAAADMPGAMFGSHFAKPEPGAHALAAEVASLREEIAALRAELAPVPSLILTGREVIEQFKRLHGVN